MAGVSAEQIGDDVNRPYAKYEHDHSLQIEYGKFII